MVATPLSYANVYAERSGCERGIVQQETEEVSSDTGHATGRKVQLLKRRVKKN